MLITPAALLESKNALASLLEQAMSAKTEKQFMTATRALYLLVEKIQQQLAGAQVTLSQLLEEQEALRQETVRLKQWSHEYKSYALHSLPAGTFVYRLKSLTDRAAADYYLCVRCFQNHVKSIMQPTEPNLLACQTCESSIQIRPPLRARP